MGGRDSLSDGMARQDAEMCLLEVVAYRFSPGLLWCAAVSLAMDGVGWE